MFRSLSGFRAEYQGLRMVVVSEFDEWKVLIIGPEATIQGARQFTQNKAQDHALAIARAYIENERHQTPEPPDAVQWIPTAAGDWLKWQA